MEVYLINRETNEIKDAYINVYKWAENFVECINNGLRSKFYCNSEIEYFTDKIPEEVEND